MAKINFCRLCGKPRESAKQQYCNKCLSHFEILDKETWERSTAEDKIMERKFK